MMGATTRDISPIHHVLLSVDLIDVSEKEPKKNEEGFQSFENMITITITLF